MKTMTWQGIIYLVSCGGYMWAYHLPLFCCLH